MCWWQMVYIKYHVGLVYSLQDRQHPPTFSTAQFGLEWITKGLNLRSAKRRRGYRDWDVRAKLAYAT